MSVRAEIDRALSLVAKDPNAAYAMFKQLLDAHLGDVELHNAVERHAPDLGLGHKLRINCKIDDRDELYHHIRNTVDVRDAPHHYLTDGWRTLKELMHLLELLDRPITRQKSVLEFAHGYGRFTRHLAPLLAGRLSVSDIAPGANEFAANEFQVHAVASHREGLKIEWPQQYEVVLALHFFSHLPARAWKPWLKSLFSAVKPGGLLVLSVFAENCVKPLGAEFERDGYYFHPESESLLLNAKEWGRMYTTRDFVHGQIEQALTLSPRLHTDVWFWHDQDAVVIEKPLR
jgi:SAM-dependent methyltransferase